MAITYTGGITIAGGITQTVLGVGGSTSYNGTTQYLTVPANAAFAFGTGEFTIECWINKPSAVNSSIVDTRVSLTAIPWGFYVDESNYPYFYDGTIYKSSVAIVNNVWNHVAVVRTSGVLKIFVNGVQGYSASLSAALNGTGTANIAGYPAYTTGYISNLRIVKGTAVYTAAFTPPTSPLTSLQSANVNGYPSAAITGTSTSLLLNMPNNSSYLNDSSTNGFTVTNAGSVPSSSLTPFNPGSILFNGTSQYLSVPTNAAYAFGTGDFTVESWIIQNDGSGNRPICQSDALGSSSNDKWWFAIAGGGLFFGTHNSGGFSVVTATSFTLGTWYHVAVTRTSGVMKLFINGVSTAYTTTGTPSGYSLSQNGMTIGAMSTPSYWAGYLSNLRVVKGLAVYTPTGSVLFNGTNQYLSVPDNVALTVGASDFTLECWIYPTSFVGNQYMWFHRNNTLLAIGLGFGLEVTTGNIRLFAGDSESTAWEISYISPTGVSLNAWSHVAVTRSANTWRVYLNGSLMSTITNSVTVFDTGVAYIGGASATTGPFSGYISNLRLVKGTAVYNNPLSSSGSILFNGTTQYLTLPNSSTPINISSGDFTVECWFNTNSISNGGLGQTLLYLGGNTSSYATVRLGLDTTGLVLYISVDGTTYSITSGIIGTVVSNTWYHVALTRSTSTFKVYLNGTQVGTNYTQAGTLYAGTLNYIGALNYSAIVTNPFRLMNGYISNVRITKGVVVYTAAFTPSQVPLTSTQSANVNGTPSTAITGTSTGLLLNTPNSASYLTDSSTNNLTVTNVGTATSQLVSPFVSGFTPSTRPLTSTQNANVNGIPSSAITGTSTSLLLNTANNSSFLTDSSTNGFTVTNGNGSTSQALAPFSNSFTTPTTPFTSTQSASVNGNPSAAITGTSTSLLLNTQNGPAFIVDGSTNNAILTNTGSATTQSSIPFSL